MANSFSVAMCTYQGERFVDEQLASIAAQTRTPDELVVCDDCSTDQTVQIVERFAASAGFPVRLYVNERNLGSTQNFGKAIDLCTGDLIALSDQDDLWLPLKLERMEAEFERSPALGLIFTNAEVVDENLRPLGHSLWEKVGFDREMQRRVRKRARALDVLLPGWTVTGATMAFRSEFRKLFVPIPNDLAMIHDGWIALVIAAVAEVAFIDECLIKYRQHPQQQIGAPEEKKAEDGKAQWDNLRSVVQRRNSYTELLKITERLCERLEVHLAFAGRQEVVEPLKKRMTHLRARSNMPHAKAERLAVVLRELLALRYHRYSNGIYSAAKDLMRAGGRGS